MSVSLTGAVERQFGATCEAWGRSNVFWLIIQILITTSNALDKHSSKLMWREQ
jgi:hypothetical protein